ncbi:MAG: trigger factor [Proteobacteria bacterium]|nr:trigger factor [Pseudomonadota bacterium]
MQVTVEDVSSVKKILHIEVPHQEVSRELDKAYDNLKKTAKIKGFRPGKAPRSVLERFYRKDVHSDVTSRLLQDSFVEAIKQTDLKIVGNPKIEPPGLDDKGPYKYEATVEIQPEIGTIDFKGLALKKSLYRITDEEMNAQLKMLQKNLTKLESIPEDRPVQENDFVLIDYEGFKDGEPFAETQKTENFSMKIGDGNIIKDLDEQIIGMQPGQNKDIQVQFPEDYFNAKLANQKITFKIALKEIRTENIPEIDDQFAKQLGRYDNLDALKQAITDNLNRGYARRVDQELNEQIFTALIAKTEFELPESMVEYELEGIIADAEKSFAYHNTSMEALGLTREKLSEEYRDTAEKQVRRHLILSRIIEQENLKLSDEDLENGFKEMSDVVGQSTESIRNFYQQDQDKLAVFKHSLLEKQTIKLIIESSAIEEVAPELISQSENDEQDTD